MSAEETTLTPDELKNEINSCWRSLNRLQQNVELLKGSLKGASFTLPFVLLDCSDAQIQLIRDALQERIDELRSQAVTDRGLPSPTWTNQKAGELLFLKELMAGLELASAS